jgi:hypothetical protein
MMLGRVRPGESWSPEVFSGPGESVSLYHCDIYRLRELTHLWTQRRMRRL